MSPFTLSPDRSIVPPICWTSTSYGSARPSAALAPQITPPFSSLDVLAPLPDGQPVHFNVRLLQTPPVGPLHNIPSATLKSP